MCNYCLQISSYQHYFYSFINDYYVSPEPEMNIKMCVQVLSIKLYHSKHTRYRIKSIIDYPHDICLTVCFYLSLHLIILLYLSYLLLFIAYSVKYDVGKVYSLAEYCLQNIWLLALIIERGEKIISYHFPTTYVYTSTKIISDCTVREECSLTRKQNEIIRVSETFFLGLLVA